MKKIKLLTYQTEIDNDLKKVNESVTRFNSIIEKANELLKSKRRQKLTETELRTFLVHPRQILTKKLCEGVKISGMVLTEQKVLELLEVSLNHYSTEAEQLKDFVEFVKLENGTVTIDPDAITKIEDRHTTYATSPEQIEVVDSLQAIIDAFDSIQGKLGIQLNYNALGEATKGAINTYHGTRCFKPDALNLLASHVLIKEKAELL